jgi:hypothetical protein
MKSERDLTKPTIIQTLLNNHNAVSHLMEEFQNKVIIMTKFSHKDNNQEELSIL